MPRLKRLENRTLVLIPGTLAAVSGAADADVEDANDDGDDGQREEWQQEDTGFRCHNGLCI